MILPAIIQLLVAKNRVKTADSFDQNNNKSSISEPKINRSNDKMNYPRVFLKSKVVSRLCTYIFILFSLFVFSSSVQAACTASLNADWGEDVAGTVVITNESDVTLNGWTIAWGYTNPGLYNKLNGGWNAIFTDSGSGSISDPYIATPEWYNGSIPPSGSVDSAGDPNNFTDFVYVLKSFDFVDPTFNSALCEPVTSSLTLVKKIVNDNGGTAVVGDFGLAVNGVTPTFDTVTTVGATTTYTSTALRVYAGTYTLAELDSAGYNEGSWSCKDANGTDVNTVSTFHNGSVEIATGENVTCTIENNDIDYINNPPPASANVCEAGTQIFGEDFGTGSPASSTDVLNHGIMPTGTDVPADGWYILKDPRTVSATYFGGGNLYDHTGGDTGGRALIINMLNSPVLFYEKVVTGITPNSPLSFQAWINGTCIGDTGVPCADKGLVEFIVEDSMGTAIYSSGAGNGEEIPNDQTWSVRKSDTFNSGSNTSLTIKIRNDAASGTDGNDLLIDDIALCQLPSADISVVKELVTTGSIASGDTVTYTVTVSNAGPDAATNVVVTDLPTNLTVTSASGTDSNCTISPATGTPASTPEVTCTIVTLGFGASNNKTITIEATAP